MSTWPPKTNYAAGDILTAAQMTDIGNQMTPLGYTAGKNKIINGDFGVWARGTSFNYTGSGAVIFAADRWSIYANGNGSFVFSQQTFTPGAAPVAGYEGQYFNRINVSTVGTSTDWNYTTKIEDVRTFAGQTVTYSFWAKASGTQSLALDFSQNFGSGGSASVAVTTSKVTLTSSWVRYTGTVAIPSISGKTIGSSSYLGATFSVGAAYGGAIAAGTIDIWGVQVEAGSTATPFQTATGTKQGELAACQRYYETGNAVWAGYGTNAVAFGSYIPFKVTKRSTPTITTAANGQSGFNNTPVASDTTTDATMIKETANATAGGYWLATWTASSEL